MAIHCDKCFVTHLSDTVPPEVEVTATLTRVVVRNSTTLTCTVTRSNPMGYIYRWVHNDSITLSETSSMLTVSIMTESDVGVYRCEVTNSAGLSGSNTTTIELGGEYYKLLTYISYAAGCTFPMESWDLISLTCKKMTIPVLLEYT